MPDQGSKYIKFIKKQILSKYVFKKEIQLGNLLLFHLHNHENARIFFFRGNRFTFLFDNSGLTHLKTNLSVFLTVN